MRLRKLRVTNNVRCAATVTEDNEYKIRFPDENFRIWGLFCLLPGGGTDVIHDSYMSLWT